MPVGFHSLVDGAAASTARLEAETVAYLAAMSNQPTASRRAHINAFIRGLKHDGVLARLDLLYLLAGHDDQATRVNIITPGSYTITKINSPRFTTDGGWDSNAAAGYLDTGFNASTAVGRKIAQNDSSVGVSVLVDVNDSTSNFMVIGAGTTRFNPRTANLTRSRLTGSADVTSANTNGKGFWSLSRAASTGYDLRKNNAAVSSPTDTSAAPSNLNVLLLSLAGANLSGKTIGMAFVGQSISAARSDALRDRYNTYCAAIGVTPE